MAVTIDITFPIIRKLASYKPVARNNVTCSPNGASNKILSHRNTTTTMLTSATAIASNTDRLILKPFLSSNHKLNANVVNTNAKMFGNGLDA